ncbi:hypothetical protein B0H67DRAFT_677503 [Lasiosphaeris hirsuta]|uniref:Uncharacterized protein n=1 Tax=Lasiosphaeris hirsuta TaxID=260670 RepID=A0AA40B878_9PEZI|nr:hypothetical protein B0H67DRAFT_677503 [Lasiosphaeris hirsuta]
MAAIIPRIMMEALGMMIDGAAKMMFTPSTALGALVSLAAFLAIPAAAAAVPGDAPAAVLEPRAWLSNLHVGTAGHG